ncbi:patatin-like phospholipase family protein [Azospirillum sp. sgz302134]
MGTIRILAVDGGGVRGILPAKVLTWLEAKTGKRCSEMFHFMAGTSTGSVLATGLSKPDPYSAKEMLDIYLKDSGPIFSRSLLRTIFTLDGLIAPKYSPAVYERVLKDTFGTHTLLSEVRDVELLLTTYDLYGSRPYFFKSWRARGDMSARARAEAHLSGDTVEDNRLRDYPLWEAVRASSAAPTYWAPSLPRSRAGTTFPAADGGVYANDPAMCAFASVLRMYRKEITSGTLGVQIVSLGTGGLNYKYTYRESRRWGKLGWMLPSLNVMFDGTNKTVDYQLREIFGGSACGGDQLLAALPGLQNSETSYYRIQSDMGLEKDNPANASSSLDDASPENLAKLMVAADAMIENNLPCLEQLAASLKSDRVVLPADTTTPEPAEPALA